MAGCTSGPFLLPGFTLTVTFMSLDYNSNMANKLPPAEAQPYSPEKQPPLEFSGGWDLIVNGEMLTAHDGIELLRRALAEGRDYILAQIEHRFQDTRRQLPQHPEIFPPPMGVMLLGKLPGKVNRPFQFFTEDAYFRGSNPYNDPEILREEFRPFWQAVEEAGFTPSVWDRPDDYHTREIVLMVSLPGASYGGATYDPE